MAQFKFLGIVEEQPDEPWTFVLTPKPELPQTLEADESGMISAATYSRPPGPSSSTGMRCQECEVEAEGDAKGWEALLVDLDDDGQDEVAFYCAVCAEREFHGVE